jgi:hypothetical protein
MAAIRLTRILGIKRPHSVVPQFLNQSKLPPAAATCLDSACVHNSSSNDYIVHSVHETVYAPPALFQARMHASG